MLFSSFFKKISVKKARYTWKVINFYTFAKLITVLECLLGFV